MPEPMTTAGSTSLTVLFVAACGPMAGPYAVIVFAALAGSLWSLLAARTAGRPEGFWLLLRCTGTSVVLASLGATLMERVLGIPSIELLAPVALFIAAMGDGWRPVFAGVAAAVGAAVSKGERHD